MFRQHSWEVSNFCGLRLALRLYRALLACIATGILSVTFISFGQQPINLVGTLIYIVENNAQLQLVIQSGNVRTVTSISSSQCIRFSEDGRYLAESSENSPLVVKSVTSQNIILQVNWSPLWEPCNFTFISTDTIAVAELNGDEYYLVNVTTGQVAGPMIPPSNLPDYSFLPQKLTSRWVLASPNNQNHFYARCTGSAVGSLPDLSCTNQVDWVIASSGQQFLLTDTNGGALASFSGQRLNGASWSPNSRYLAYLAYVGATQNSFPLRIFDVQNPQAPSSLNFVSVNVNQNFGLHWSSDSALVAMWIYGRIGEPLPGDLSQFNLYHLVFYNVVQNTFVSAHTPSNVNPVQNLGFWSPDNQSYVFRDAFDNLVQANASNGALSVIETNVVDVITWLPDEP